MLRTVKKKKLQTLKLPVSPYGSLEGRIAQRAYELYAERGYRQGCDLDDWYEAEREVLGRKLSG